MKQFFTFTCLLMLCLAGLAQTKNGKLYGSIKNAEGKPFASATVSVIRTKDSSLVKTALTNEKGQYEIEFLPAGSFVVSATGTGHQKAVSKPVILDENNLSVKVEDMQLTVSAANLKEVTILSKKPFNETRVDKTVVNVDASPTSA